MVQTRRNFEPCVTVKGNWGNGYLVECNERKLLWDFEYTLRVTKRASKPDLTLEKGAAKNILIEDMACPQEYKITDKHREKPNKYQQLTFKTTEKRPRYGITILPMIIGCLGDGMKMLEEQVAKMKNDKKEGACKNM